MSSRLTPAMSNRGKILLIDHEAHAGCCPAVAGALLEAAKAVKYGGLKFMEAAHVKDLIALPHANLYEKGVGVARVDSFTFVSNDFKHEVEAFLTRPVGLAEAA